MKILVAIDCQRDFFSGSLANNYAVSIIPNICEKIREYGERGDKIFFTKDTHFDSYLDTFEGKNLPIPHCIFQTEGWLIVPEIEKVARPYDTIEKVKFTFGDLGLPTYINTSIPAGVKIEEIGIVGVVTSICVAANATILRAAFPEIPIVVYEDCCAGLSKEDHDAALKTMAAQMISIK